ncbi:unnamed protein product [Ectocarpus sp. 12 AP-2014]
MFFVSFASRTSTVWKGTFKRTTTPSLLSARSRDVLTGANRSQT